MSVLIQLPHRCCIWLKPNRRLEKEGLIYLKVDTMCSLSSLNIGNLADFFNTKNMLDNSGTCLQRGFWSVANMIYKAKVYLGNTKKKKKKEFLGCSRAPGKKPEQVRATYSKSLYDSHDKSSWGRLGFQREGLFLYQMGRFQTQHLTPAIDSEAHLLASLEYRRPDRCSVLMLYVGQSDEMSTLPLQKRYLPNVF